MKLLVYYSVFTRRLVSPLGSKQIQVANCFTWEYKARKDNIIFHISHALHSQQSSGNLPNQPKVIRCRHIGYHGRDQTQWIKTSWNTCGDCLLTERTSFAGFCLHDSGVVPDSCKQYRLRCPIRNPLAKSGALFPRAR